MGKKKHRLSALFEDPLADPAVETIEEAVDASPVQVAYPSPAYGFPAEEAPIEECPAPEEPIWKDDFPAEGSAAKLYYFSEEASPAEEPLAVEEAELALQEELAEDPPAEEAEPEIQEKPAESLLAEEAAAEPGPVEAAEEETLPHTDVPTESKAEDYDERDAEDAEKLTDQPGEVVLVCTSCTRMLLIEYDGAFPYNITALTCPDHESFSWLLHTTCLSCLNKHKQEWVSRDSFSSECMAAFTSAVLSEEFMMQTRWFEIAERVCQKPTSIVMDREQRSVAYVKIDVMREETTDKCRTMGLKYAGRMRAKVRRSEIVQSFAPGGFM